MALAVNPEKLTENNTEVIDEEEDDGIPDAMKYRSVGVSEDFRLKFFMLRTRIQYSFKEECYLFRGEATPYSPFYKVKKICEQD